MPTSVNDGGVALRFLVKSLELDDSRNRYSTRPVNGVVRVIVAMASVRVIRLRTNNQRRVPLSLLRSQVVQKMKATSYCYRSTGRARALEEVFIPNTAREQMRINLNFFF